MNLYLKTLAGLEALAAEELKAAGATHIEVGRRGIAFEGDAKVLYAICMHSRSRPKPLMTCIGRVRDSRGRTCSPPTVLL